MVVTAKQHTRRMNHEVATTTFFKHTQSSCVTVFLRRNNLNPFTFTKSLVDEQIFLGTGAGNEGAVLAAILGPDDVWRRGGLSTAGDNKTLALDGEEVFRVG